jgi:hypothetical protein
VDDPVTYLAEIEMALVASPIVAEYRLVRSWANTDDGYIRVRATLSNDDFLEAAEYFIIQEGQIAVVDYRHQWMDATRTVLRRRWDNTPDHPELDSFPHHCHVGDESHVVPSEPVSLTQVLTLIEAEIGPPSMD